MLRIANLSSTGMCKKLHQKRNCNTRTPTDFLARMREHLVVTALQKQTDLIGMCDIDFRHFNETAFLELFELRARLEADGVFGVRICRSSSKNLRHGFDRTTICDEKYDRKTHTARTRSEGLFRLWNLPCGLDSDAKRILPRTLPIACKIRSKPDG